MRHPGGERVEIVLEAQSSDVPWACRVRGLLKAALRTWGLRCVSVRDVTAQPPMPDATPTIAPDTSRGDETAVGTSDAPAGL